MVTCSVGFCRCPRFISCYIHARIPLVLVNYIKKKSEEFFKNVSGIILKKKLRFSPNENHDYKSNLIFNLTNFNRYSCYDFVKI